MVEGAWFFGGVERTPERRFFAVEVEDRSADTNRSIIKKFVEPKSIIFTDFWKAYDTAIEEINFINDIEIYKHEK